jgi:hypothetical protein
MTTGRNGRKDDLRALSHQQSARSRIQDDSRPIAPRALVGAKDREEQKRVDPRTQADLERRNARAHSAMPYGTKGSRRGIPAGEPPLENPPNTL